MFQCMWTKTKRQRQRETQLRLNLSLPASWTKVWPEPPTTFPKIAVAALPKQLNKSGQRSRSRRRSTERQAIQFKHLHWHIDSYLNSAVALKRPRVGGGKVSFLDTKTPSNKGESTSKQNELQIKRFSRQQQWFIWFWQSCTCSLFNTSAKIIAIE